MPAHPPKVYAARKKHASHTHPHAYAYYSYARTQHTRANAHADPGEAEVERARGIERGRERNRWRRVERKGESATRRDGRTETEAAELAGAAGGDEGMHRELFAA